MSDTKTDWGASLFIAALGIIVVVCGVGIYFAFTYGLGFLLYLFESHGALTIGAIIVVVICSVIVANHRN